MEMEAVISPEELRNEIVKSIKVPFNNRDTLVVSNVFAICGTGKQRILFDTHIDRACYNQAIVSQTGMKVIRSTQPGADSLIKRDTLSSSIVSGEFVAEQVSDKEVIVTESYEFNDTLKTIVKVFSYKRKHWTYKIGNGDTKANGIYKPITMWL
jgi:hypothetical protein